MSAGRAGTVQQQNLIPSHDTLRSTSWTAAPSALPEDSIFDDPPPMWMAHLYHSSHADSWPTVCCLRLLRLRQGRGFII